METETVKTEVEPLFKSGNVVMTPIGKMKVVSEAGRTLIGNEWVPHFWVGFITSKGRVHKGKRYRIFPQNKITMF